MVTPFLTNIVLTDEVGGTSFKVCIEVYYHCEDRALVLMGHPGTINVGGKVTTRLVFPKLATFVESKRFPCAFVSETYGSNANDLSTSQKWFDSLPEAINQLFAER